MKYQAVPVIMYHSIGLKSRKLRHLICPLDLFEAHLRYMQRMKMRTISLHELYGHMKNGDRIDENPVVLTFDDGYLDNWVFAYPLLKKYGFRGTIFVNPEFADPRPVVRKNLHDVWDNKMSVDLLETAGFLSWEEMKIMESEGVMDIQSHSMSHTWYFCSDEIIDFHHPGNSRYAWLFWNTCPDRKAFYLGENQEHCVPYGTPIYKNDRSLRIRRYFEDKELNEYMADFVRKQNDDFFDEEDWRDKLFHEVEQYKSRNGLKGRHETDEEMEERYRYELVRCREILEDRLKKKVEFLCWAGAAYNKTSLTIAEEAGYLSSTLYFNDANRKNIYGEDPSVVNRTGCVSEFSWHNKFISYTSPVYFIANMKVFCGEKKYIWIMRLQKLKLLVIFFVSKLFRKGS